MRLNDAVWGVLLLFFSAVIVVHVQGFPKIPGQQVGPALFPGFLAVALGVCGVLLVLKGLAAKREWGAQEKWVAFAEWMRSGHHLLAFLLTVGVNIFYIVAVNPLGFIVTGVIYLAVLFRVFGVRGRWIVPLAVVVTLVIHYAFYKLLKVPLPWGLLQSVAW
ncbi:MAG TPA: tripartite tricarboxylate transporter TctB family protein [Casimicrobiaceae bacterium]|nr:tripartite tricarboxylate transporter TctB family protein [Casimicrobiaceae bacterium]